MSFGKAPRTARGVAVFRVQKPDRPELPRLRPIERAQEEPGGPFFIHGMRASDLEWRVWRMLFKIGWSAERIRYQVDILGGRKPGGQVLDFVLDGGAVLYVVFVNGDYWHKYGVKYNETMAAQQEVTKVWPSARVFALFNADLATDEIAISTLLRTVGRGF